ncbi:putative cytochrome b6/f complex, subunit 5 [Helianthus annuus]|nr:putative cytochrome b6/f complex, subunit 5 [Helianthus annuus]KAJ0484680.1 putative cytochrome b6/f complex, subunit 5 [Helianthus annuus]KAJ0629127.1 putative cytochrome b6/f complex, subunit 5 [Helianthus annuus]KAJ0658933.1 putative cytochrome b6/f complex, subunit 5 [Helianthus annuus]KAJ0839180.1 putative cytochrome b6/f complex, subunit 5 [Helianthus annuus]
MIEVFLFGIVLGLIPITLPGLFVTVYLQYKCGDQLDLRLINNSFFIDLLLSLISRRSIKIAVPVPVSVSVEFDRRRSESRPKYTQKYTRKYL